VQSKYKFLYLTSFFYVFFEYDDKKSIFALEKFTYVN
jgi:hypothetical protein